MGDCFNERRKLSMENRSPWSSESTGSTSPLPVTQDRPKFRLEKSGSGGSTCSLGSSPGASFNSSLTVPDYNPTGCPQASKPTRSTSPFNIKARVKRRREKRLEKQANLTIGLEDGHQLHPDMQYMATSPNGASEHAKEKPTPSFRFKDIRKRSKESLSFRRNKNHTTVDVGGDHLLSINAHSAGTSPEARSPRSPVSPGQCKCRRCSLLPLEECEPKEVSALFKFLRKSKVGWRSIKGLFSPLEINLIWDSVLTLGRVSATLQKTRRQSMKQNRGRSFRTKNKFLSCDTKHPFSYLCSSNWPTSVPHSRDLFLGNNFVQRKEKLHPKTWRKVHFLKNDLFFGYNCKIFFL